MTDWDTSPDLMIEIKKRIVPISTEEALRDVLTHHFPQDCSNLPIAGGWGYSQADAIQFVRALFEKSNATDPVEKPKLNFVPFEYHIAQKIAYEELIIFQPKDLRFSGIELELNEQQLVNDRGAFFDVLNICISCWSDRHYDQLKIEWEENDFGRSPSFDRDAHLMRRAESQISYDRTLWFNITDVW